MKAEQCVFNLYIREEPASKICSVSFLFYNANGGKVTAGETQEEGDTGGWREGV